MYEAKVGRHSATTVIGFQNYANYVFGETGDGEIWKALGVTVVLWILNFVPQ